MVLLLVRGVLLWIVAPLAFALWLALSPWLLVKKVGPGRFLGWVDLNLIAFLQRSVARPFFPEPAPWTPVSTLPAVTHRISLDYFLDV